MRPSRIRIATIATVLSATFSVAQQTSAASNPWAVFIRSGKASPYVVGEPVIVKVVLTNTGESTQKISPQLDGVTQSAMYYVSSDGKKFRPVNSFNLVAEPSQAPVPLAPGESIYHDEMLLFDANANGLLFPDPGRYYLRVKSIFAETDSNTIEISVIEPKGEEREAAESVKSNVVAWALQGFEKSKGQHELEQIARSKTVYARYAALRLAERELDKTVTSTRVQSLPRIQRARDWLEAADQNDFPLRPSVVFLMGECQLKLKNSREASRLFERVVKEYPRSSEAQRSVQRLAYLKDGTYTQGTGEPPN